MKQLLFCICFIFITTQILHAQIVPPHAFTYSGMVRNVQGTPIANATIGIQFTILKTSITGQTVYTENQFTSTDTFGVFNLAIGTGAIQSGNFDSINWGSDNYFLKVGLDITGSTNFVSMGTTQFLSVPYALYAQSAGNLTRTTDSGFTHYIGQLFGGGIIFHVYKDSSGQEHGLIAALNDQSISTPWSNLTGTLIGSSAQSPWNGAANTIAIVNQPGHTSSAASICQNYNGGGFSDWYLPSLSELSALYNNEYVINKKLSSSGSELSFKNGYWSSTECVGSQAYVFFMDLGDNYNNGKSGFCRARAIRAF